MGEGGGDLGETVIGGWRGGSGGRGGSVGRWGFGWWRL